MCVGAGNKSSRDPCLPQCRNEAVTRKQGRISARCGLISQGSWPGIERLCHCRTAAAAATAAFLQNKNPPKKPTKGKQTKPNKRTCQHRLAHVFAERDGQVVFTGTTPEAKHHHFSVTSLDKVLPPFRAVLWGKDDKTATGTKSAGQKCWAESPH